MNTLSIILMFVCACVTVPLVIFMLVVLIYMLDATIGNNHMNKMKFKSFVSFYNINPHEWWLYDDHVQYRRNYAKFRFGCIDAIRYYLWKQQIDKNKKVKAKTEEYQQTLEYIKRDLEKFNRQNERMIKKEAEKYTENVYSLFM